MVRAFAAAEQCRERQYGRAARRLLIICERSPGGRRSRGVRLIECFARYLGVFAAGAVLGSFLGVCIRRLPRGESVVWPRSHCPRCGAALGPFELVPVLSYVALRGKCSHCGHRIPIFYPAIELATGLVFVLVVRAKGMTPEGLNCLVLASLVVVAAGIDISRGIIPDRLTLPWMAVGVAVGALPGLDGPVSRAIGLVVCGGVVFLIALLSRGGMGGGDVKLMGLVGSFLGPWDGLASFMVACFVGALVGIWLVVTGVKGRRDEIPFAPFIAVGTIAVCAAGDELIGLVAPWLVGRVWP